MRKQQVALGAFFLFALFINFGDCFARAGGSFGGGMSFWKIVIFIFLLPIFLIYMAIQAIVLSRKKNQAKKLAEKLETIDPMWNNRNMTARAEEVFLRVQQAWMERNMDLARDNITDRLYNNYKFQTDDMLKRGVKNIMNDIHISGISIFSIQDYRDNNKDSFSAKISGTMLDYEINETTNAVTKGDNKRSHYFEDIYTFLRQGSTWLADEIRNDASISDISKGRAYTEG